MNFQLRKQKILEHIEQSGFADVKDLALWLGISDITVRRDLTVLAEQGLLLRTHGGAMKVSLGQVPVGFAQKTALRAEQKEAICQRAAGLVQEGETVFLDCGSTVFRLCPYLRNLRIKVVTNSLPIAQALLGSSVSLNFAGGEIDPERQAAHGLVAAEHFRRYRADRAFVGVDGISLKNGLSAHSEKEAEMTRVMVENARAAYFLCDSSKLERDRYLPFAPLDFVQHLITDSEAAAEVVRAYEAEGVMVLR